VKLNPAELALVRSLGLYVTEKCDGDGCGTLLNRSWHYTIFGKPETYCSCVCRDAVFFGNRREAEKHARPGRCAYCDASLNGKKRGSLYCDETCRKAHARKVQVPGDAANQKIPDADAIESIVSREENRPPGQSSVPVGPDALRGTERESTPRGLPEPAPSPTPESAPRTGSPLPKGQQAFDFFPPSDLRPTRRKPMAVPVRKTRTHKTEMLSFAFPSANNV